MKKLLTYLFITLLGLIIFGCDKPAPTELVDGSTEELAEYEVLSQDLNDEYYSNGFDTTGVTQDLKGLANIISVSGIKVTGIDGNTDTFSFAQTIFFDRTKPIYYSDGRLLAYETITPGIIKFDNIRARTVPFRIRFRDNGILKDTLLGDRYILYSGRHGGMDQFHYRHNSYINFHFQMFFGQSVEFDIPTPKEVFGEAALLGRRVDRNLRAVLHWNAVSNGPKMIIVIGARLRDRQNVVIPLYRVRTKDDGGLVIPARFINKIPLNRFDRLVFTFIRRFEHSERYNGENDLYVSSQSIHSIVVNLN